MSIRSRTNFLEHIFESRSNRRRVLPIIFLKRRGTVVSYTIKKWYSSYLVQQWREIWNLNITLEISKFCSSDIGRSGRNGFSHTIWVIWGEIGCHVHYRGFDSLWHTVDSLSPSNLCYKPSNLCEFEKHRRIFVTNRRIFATPTVSSFFWNFFEIFKSQIRTLDSHVSILVSTSKFQIS